MSALLPLTILLTTCSCVLGENAGQPLLKSEDNAAGISRLALAELSTWTELEKEAVTEVSQVVGEHSWQTALISWAIWVTLVLLVCRFVYTQAVPEKDDHIGPSLLDPKKTLSNGHLDCCADLNVFFWALFCPAIRWSDTINLAGFMSFRLALGLFAAMSFLNYMNFYDVYIAGTFTSIFILYYVGTSLITMYEEKGSEADGANAAQSSTLMQLCFYLCVALVILVSLYTLNLFRLAWDPDVYYKFMSFIGFFTWGCFTTMPMVFYRRRLRAMFDLPSDSLYSTGQDCCFVFWCPCLSIAQEARTINEAYRMGHPAVAKLKPNLEEYGSVQDSSGAAGSAPMGVGAAGSGNPFAADSNSNV